MIILGFAITLLELFSTVVNTIVSRIIGNHPQPALKKTTTKNYYYNNNNNNKRPKTLDLSPIHRPERKREEEEDTTDDDNIDDDMNYAAHLGSSRQAGLMAASEMISEYRISPEFHLELREDGATFTKEWTNFTQTCNLPMVEFVELLSYSPAILQFAEDMAEDIDPEDDSLQTEVLYLNSERAIFCSSKSVEQKGGKDPVRYTNLAIKSVYRGADRKTHGISDNSCSFR